MRAHQRVLRSLITRAAAGHLPPPTNAERSAAVEDETWVTLVDLCDAIVGPATERVVHLLESVRPVVPPQWQPALQAAEHARMLALLYVVLAKDGLLKGAKPRGVYPRRLRTPAIRDAP